MVRRLLVTWIALLVTLLVPPGAYAAQTPSPQPASERDSGVPAWSIGVLLAAVAVVSVRALTRRDDATWHVYET